VVRVQGVEDDDCVHAVQELGAEKVPHLREDLVLHRLVFSQFGGLTVTARGESPGCTPDDLLGSHVGGHDEHRVAKIDLPSLGVGQAAIFHDLQEHVKDIRVSLFDLVQEDDTVGPVAHRVGQLASFPVADVTGGCADQPGGGVPLHELGHIDLDQGVLGAEEYLRQGTGEFRFAHASGAEEDKGADRPARVLQAGARAADGAGDRTDRFLLTDDAPVQFFFEAQQPGRLLLGQAGDRDAGPHGHDLGDVIRGHDGEVLIAFHQAPAQRLDPLAEAILLLTQGDRFLKVLLLDGRLLPAADLFELLQRLAQR